MNKYWFFIFVQHSGTLCSHRSPPHRGTRTKSPTFAHEPSGQGCMVSLFLYASGPTRYDFTDHVVPFFIFFGLFNNEDHSCFLLYSSQLDNYIDHRRESYRTYIRKRPSQFFWVWLLLSPTMVSDYSLSLIFVSFTPYFRCIITHFSATAQPVQSWFFSSSQHIDQSYPRVFADPDVHRPYADTSPN